MSPRNDGPAIKWFVTGYVGDATAEITVEGVNEFDAYRKLQGWTLDMWREQFPENVRSLIKNEAAVTITSIEDQAARDKRAHDRAVAEEAERAARAADAVREEAATTRRGRKRK